MCGQVHLEDTQVLFVALSVPKHVFINHLLTCVDIAGVGCTYLPSQSGHELLISLTAPTVRQDGALVFLAFSNVEHSNLVGLSATKQTIAPRVKNYFKSFSLFLLFRLKYQDKYSKSTLGLSSKIDPFNEITIPNG